MKHNIPMFLRLTFAACTLLILSGCATKRTELGYFKDIENLQTGSFGSTDYTLKVVPDDRLNISVTSIDPQASMIYNLQTELVPLADRNTNGTTVVASNTSSSYLVNSKGDITFPVLGILHVEGMTAEQIAEMLTTRISQDVEDPIVTVTISRFNVNVLGEVAKPGMVQSQGERFSIIDAISKAGDITQYGVRENILLIREEDGKKVYHHLDLTDSKIFDSPYFYLKQNDMIYVQPNSIKAENASYNVNNGYKVQVTSAIISACSVVASLVIALVIK